MFYIVDRRGRRNEQTIVIDKGDESDDYKCLVSRHFVRESRDICNKSLRSC